MIEKFVTFGPLSQILIFKFFICGRILGRFLLLKKEQIR
jgi:hypothetical protein